jgi:hypothetical protein
VTRKAKLRFGVAVLALAVIAGWPISSSEWANFELRQDWRDLAAQGGAQIGLIPPGSDEDLRRAVIHEAKHEEIQLEPEQVTVKRSGTPQTPVLYLAADYNARVNVLGFSFALHFTPSSAK